jgi:nicotinamidase-related amidase
MKFTPPPDWLEIVPELDARASDVRVTKQQWGAFYGTALDLELRRRGVTQIVLCGIATSIGVESTAREAYERGYNVALVVDAMTDMNAEAHANSLARIFPRLGETATTDAVLALVAKMA